VGVTSGVPQPEGDGLAVDHHVRAVVVEHGGDVVLREDILPQMGREMGGTRPVRGGACIWQSKPDAQRWIPHAGHRKRATESPETERPRAESAGERRTVVYEMNRQVLPTAPSPMMTHLMLSIEAAMLLPVD
jgi:hypothetical protein